MSTRTRAISVRWIPVCLSALLAALSVLGAARADSGIDTWAALQAAVNSAQYGAVIALTDDLTALETDVAINIPAGKRLTLDLNGHMLDRNRRKRDVHVGSVINVEAGAMLSLRDSGGTGVVTGGSHDNGGGILNRGTLILEGGCVTGNTALHNGGGLANYGTMLLMGGRVTGNTALEQGGGAFNHAKARLTMEDGTVSGNSAPKHGDLANEGTLTVIGAEDGGTYIEDMPVLRRFMAQLSIIPTAVLLIALLLAIWLDAYLDRDRKQGMVIIIALVFSLMLQNYLDNRLSAVGAYNGVRVPVAVYGYAVRPVILAMFLRIVKPDGDYRAVWTIVVANALVYMTAFFSDVAFHFTVAGHFKGGPLRQTCTVVSALLFGHLLYLTIRRFRPRQRRESWIPLLVTVVIAGAVAMDFNAAFNDAPISFLTLAIAISCVFYYIWLHLQFVREHEEALKAGQRVRLMLSQIKPHFLHNALTVIVGLCDMDPQRAKQATLKFARYLRGNMDSIENAGLIPFGKELEHTRLYLEIEQYRFGDALKVNYDIACDDFSVPALTLEPLVENAVRHGVRENPGGRGAVTISAREVSDHYEISVTDDGPGFDPSRLQQDDQRHVGIPNVRERLAEVCRGTLEFDVAPGRGVTVRIIIPKGQETDIC